MRPPPLRVVNVGGSLTTALVLSAVAWGVRLLRAKNILRPAERPTKPAARASSKTLYGRLSPLTFRLLVRTLEPAVRAGCSLLARSWSWSRFRLCW
jgi:hypothetical protein